MKKLVHALVLTGMVAMPALALADDAASSLTANVSLTSNYVFRGISQTGGDAAIQGGFDYTHSSGAYIGTWASNVGWIEDFQGYTTGNVEIDVYGGYRNSFGPVSYDLGLIQYSYPGSRPAGTVNADTTEAYASLGWKWFTVKYSYYLSNQVFGFDKADGSDYWDLSGSLPIADTGLTAGAHWGTFKFRNNGNQDYDDWKASLTYDLGKLGKAASGMTAGVMYTDTNAKQAYWSNPAGKGGAFLGKGTTTVWLSKSF